MACLDMPLHIKPVVPSNPHWGGHPDWVGHTVGDRTTRDKLLSLHLGCTTTETCMQCLEEKSRQTLPSASAEAAVTVSWEAGANAPGALVD